MSDNHPHGTAPALRDQPASPSPARPAPVPRRSTGPGGGSSRWPGLGLALVVALAGTGVGAVLPVVGGPVAGIVIGLLVAVVARPGRRTAPGLSFAGRQLLRLAVVVLGFQLSLTEVLRVGADSLPVMVGTLAVCLAAAHLLGRALGVTGGLRTLIGVGTGICGASAIAAVTPVIAAAGTEVAYAVSTIFLFNIAAVLTFPLLGHLLGMSGHAFGLFAGTAVNDMSSVVAAAGAYGSGATGYAVVVKLTRTLMIIPVCVGLAALAGRRSRRHDPARSEDRIGPANRTGREDPTPWGDAPRSEDPSGRARRASGGGRVRISRLVPGFLIAFLVAAAANTAGLVPAGSHRYLSAAAVFLITVALSAIGLSTDLAALRRTGPRPLLLGAGLWLLVSVTSLGLQYLTG